MGFNLNGAFNNLNVGGDLPPHMEDPRIQPSCTTIFQALTVAGEEINKQHPDRRALLASLGIVRSNLVTLLGRMGFDPENQEQLGARDQLIIQNFAARFVQITARNLEDLR